jgi:DNA polymerase I-like protein with 3'-5' exonuclease and polymerase domains
MITNGALDPFQNDVRLLQIGLDTGEVGIIDFGGISKRVPSPEEQELLLSFFSILRSHLASDKIEVLGHKLQFDFTSLQVSFGGDLVFDRVRDTFLMSKIYWSGVGIKKVGKSENRSERGVKGFHTLGKLCERLDIEIDKTQQLSDWSAPILSNAQINYAANDVRVLFKVYDRLRKKILEDKVGVSVKAELAFLPALCSIQYNGYPVSRKKAESALAEYQSELDACIRTWREYAGDLDIQKTKLDMLPFFQSLGIELESTAKEHLALIDHPAAKALLEYRGLKKSVDYLVSTLKKAEVSEQCGFGFRLRSSYNQIATSWRTSSTGKITGTNPNTGRRQTTDLPLAMNLQQIPNLSDSQGKKHLSNIRGVFAAPEGRKIIIADLSQAHSRIAAQMFKDKTQLSIYNEGKDGHLLVATKLLEVEGYKHTFDEVLKFYSDAKKKPHDEWSDFEKQIKYKRDQGKTGFYSFLNQAGAKTMQLSFKGYGIDVSEEFCKTLIYILRETNEVLYKGIMETMSVVNLPPSEGGQQYNFEHFTDSDGKPIPGDYGVVYGLPCEKFGGSRSRNFCLKTKRTNEFIGYDGKKKKVTRYEVAFTDTISFMWLSTEAIIMKLSCGEIYTEINKPSNAKWEAKLINMVHDQVDLECSEEYALEVATMVGTIIKKNLELFITDLPVEESGTDYANWIGQSMGDLH